MPGRTTLRITLLLALGACSRTKASSESAAFHPLEVGAQVPTYAMQSLTGDTVSIGASGSPTVLNVWATWCESCREEMQALDSLKNEFGKNGTRVIAVSIDQGSPEKVKRFSEANKLHFIVVHDPTAEIEKSYPVVGVPTTFVIDGKGRLVWQQTGNIASNFAEARTAVQKAAGL